MNDEIKYLGAGVTEKEEGASMLEYALLAALIAIVAVVALIFLGQESSTTFSHVGVSIGSGR